MALHTSDSNPLRVDFLPADAGLGPGRLGMTIAPGKKAPGIAGQWERNLDADLERLVSEYGVNVLVSLLATHEYDAFGIADLPAAAAEHGLEFVSLPIQDGGIPPSVTDALAFVKLILERLGSGATVVVHCRGGLGRTGLVAACCLTTVEHEPEKAIAMVRAARSGAIENSMQEKFIATFAEEWNRVASSPDQGSSRG